jgi:hypothetical protein
MYGLGVLHRVSSNRGQGRTQGEVRVTHIDKKDGVFATHGMSGEICIPNDTRYEY